MVRPSFRWWHAVLVFLVANAVSALPAGYGGDAVFYNDFALPRVAPPDRLFAPVWLSLNVTSLVALALVANSPRRPARQAFLASEAVNWVLFAAFTTLYFGMGSPVFGAIDTVASLAVSIASLALACRIDRRAASGVLLRVLWLALASYVSVFVALHNPDPLF